MGHGAHRAGMDETPAWIGDTPACRTPAWAIRPHAARPHGRYARMGGQMTLAEGGG